MPPFKTGEVIKTEKKNCLRVWGTHCLQKGFFLTQKTQIYLGFVSFNDTGVFNLIICHCKKKLFQIPMPNFNSFSLKFLSTDVTPQCQKRFLD